MSATVHNLPSAVAELHDLAAERCVLTNLLILAHAGDLGAADRLEPGELYLPEHARILAAAYEVYDAGGTVDGYSMRQAINAREAPSRRVLETLQALELGDTRIAQMRSAIERVRELAVARRAREQLRRAIAALERGEHEAAREHIALATDAKAPGKPQIVLLGTDEIFAPLPATPWKVHGLQIAPGRPAMIAGYGASAKTLSAQSLALAAAAGRSVWERFETEPSRVLHLDYEQGKHATSKRYQRLAVGHGIDSSELAGRLSLAVFPRVFLDSPGAADAYARACEGFDLVILDALRGATPTRDENDSQIRGCVDTLTLVSERTGAAFVVIHHAGKPKEGHAADVRTILRGSSAIFDACGCVFVIGAPKSDGEPRTVKQAKQPAEAEGGGLDDFGLMVEDVAIGADATAGVRVMHRAIERGEAAPDAAYERNASRLLEVIRKNPGASRTLIAHKAGMQKSTALSVLDALADEGRIAAVPGPRGAQTYRIGGEA